MSRRAALGLVAVLGTSACFQDNFVPSSDDDDALPGSSSDVGDGTTSGPGGTTTALDPDSTTGLATSDGTTEGDGPADTVGDDSSTGGEDSDSSGDDSTGVTPASVDDLMPGDLVITEVMWNPTCNADDCEWIEVYNATAVPVNLLDLFIQDSDYNPGNQGRITDDVIVEPGGVAVLTRGLTFWNYDFEPDSVYGPQPGFNNGDLELAVLLNSTEILDETWFFYFDADEGVSWSLSGDSLDAVSNDDPESWCDGVDELMTFTTTEYGTPGVINPPC